MDAVRADVSRLFGHECRADLFQDHHCTLPASMACQRSGRGHLAVQGLPWLSKADVTAYRWENRYTIQPRPRFHISTYAEPIIVEVTCANGDVADMPWMMLLMMMMMMMMMMCRTRAGERVEDDETEQTAHRSCHVYNIPIGKQQSNPQLASI